MARTPLRSGHSSVIAIEDLARRHHKHRKSTNLLERLIEEIKRRTRVVRISPSPASCLRPIRALCAETHEGWLEDNRYINMRLQTKRHRGSLRAAAVRQGLISATAEPAAAA